MSLGEKHILRNNLVNMHTLQLCVSHNDLDFMRSNVQIAFLPDDTNI